MMSKMLTIASFVAAASAYDGLWITTDGVCDASVCPHQTTFDGQNCVMPGAAGGSCYIPACFSSGQTPSGTACTLKEPKAGTITVKEPADPTMGGGSSLPSTTPTSGMTSATLVQGMKGWQDIPASSLFHYPPSLIGRRGMIPSAYIKPYWTVEFDCPKGYSGEGKMCDAFVFLYRCPPCTYQDGGNLAVDLLANGWTPYSCSVEFMLDKTVPTYHHKTMVYHKQVAEGAYEDVMPTALLELAWFASSPATSHCASYLNENDCENQLPGECEWDDTHGTCDRVLCPLPVKPHPQGPWQPKCTVCIDDERAQYMPALK
eukprot:TRINITY_DN24_c0_g1_i3.p2 TRINITY_DN24_c0_g1~~TRINITY_DN24_c0_g1_i3.p2  ORF type:complete len:317 (+),score=107.63 TRINITY_DN24_c0_g1_i3:75-1025(+)